LYLHKFFAEFIFLASKGDSLEGNFSASTYPLVEVDGVLARHHVGDSRAGLLAGVCGGHFWMLSMGNSGDWIGVGRD
jgi:hypothetical protein